MSRRSAQGRTAKASRGLRVLAALMVIAMVVTLAGLGVIWWSGRADGTGDAASASQSTGADASKAGPEGDVDRDASPAPDMSPKSQARRIVAAMSPEERVGQLVMAPLFAGTSPSTLQSLIADRHVGSVLVIGNWNSGVAGVRQAVDTLRGYAPAGKALLSATDQEGGLVQHLKGAGFDLMPSAVAQGRMSTDQLKASAAVWGGQLKQAGIDVDLAPVAGTVQVARRSNAPIGALNRDFGLDSAGNAAHAVAFSQGMGQAGVGTAIKHYPGLGAVTGNTDFTTNGILDTTTTLDGSEIGAFNTAISQAQPSMVMMSLATYQRIDPAAPAAFSSTIIDGELRGKQGYDGVVISDSLSAAALSGVPTDQLGVRLIEAGGDLACIGQFDYVAPILNGLNARNASDAAFAEKVTRSAERVVELKIKLGLLG